MTVKELIEGLKKCDQDLDVLFDGNGINYILQKKDVVITGDVKNAEDVCNIVHLG